MAKRGCLPDNTGKRKKKIQKPKTLARFGLWLEEGVSALPFSSLAWGDGSWAEGHRNLKGMVCHAGRS